jgi:hypothetical protein
MSILDNSSSQKPIPEIIAANIKVTARQTFESMVRAFNTGSQTFWNNPRATPSEIAAALGTDAKEVFELHYALGQLIANIKPESISSGLGLIGQFTMNEDGTVTIVESVPPPVNL